MEKFKVIIKVTVEDVGISLIVIEKDIEAENLKAAEALAIANVTHKLKVEVDVPKELAPAKKAVCREEPHERTHPIKKRRKRNASK